jgi:hypothetical protein
MTRIRKCGLAVLVGFAAVGGCVCVRLDAVTATSKIGERLADYSPQTRVIVDNCHLLRALNRAKTCPKDADRWSNALDMLVSYSKELERAADSKGPSVQDNVNKALDQVTAQHWSSLAKDDNQKIATVASAVTAFLFREATRSSLQRAIREAGPGLDEVVSLLVAHLQIEQAQLALLRCDVSCQAGSPLDTKACPQTSAATCTVRDEATAFGFARFSVELDVQDHSLSDAQKAVKAFGAAHRQLYKHVNELDAKETIGAVLEDISAAMKATNSGNKDGGSNG